MNLMIPAARTARRGFSIIEMLVALTITGTLLTATLVALDTAFKGYKVATEGASSHVVTRIVIDRIMAMVRTGTDFGPYPADVLDADQNPLQSTSIEFIARTDEDAGTRTIVSIERRTAGDVSDGPYELWYVETVMSGDEQESQMATLMLTNVQEITFTLEYDIGPKLLRATIDLTVEPNDVQDATIKSDIAAPVLRLVSTVAPRRLEEDY